MVTNNLSNKSAQLGASRPLIKNKKKNVFALFLGLRL